MAKSKVFIQKNPLMENMRRQSESKSTTPMLDYSGFSRPDQATLEGWTIMGCFMALITSAGVLLGGALIMVTGWLFVTELLLPTPEVKQETVEVDTDTIGKKNVFTVSSYRDLVSSMAVTPDGLYMISGGGAMGYVAPSLSQNDQETEEATSKEDEDLEAKEAREKAEAEKKRRELEEVARAAAKKKALKAIGIDESTVAAGESNSNVEGKAEGNTEADAAGETAESAGGENAAPAPGENAESSENAGTTAENAVAGNSDAGSTESGASNETPSGENAGTGEDVKTASQKKGPLTYIDEVCEPTEQYEDYLQIQKDGIRQTTDVELLKSEEEALRKRQAVVLDPKVLIADQAYTKTDMETLAALQDLPENFMEDTPDSEETRAERIWRITRKRLQTYPVAIWSTKSCEPVIVFWEHFYPIVSISISPDGNEFISADKAGYVILWRLKEASDEEGLIVKDGKRYNWKKVRLFTPRSRMRQGQGRIQSIHSAIFTPSGKQLLISGIAESVDESGNIIGKYGTLVLWDIEAWEEVTRLRPASVRLDSWFQTYHPVGQFTDICFTPNGKYLIAGAAGTNAGVYWFELTGQGRCMANLKHQRHQDPKRDYADTGTTSSAVGANLLMGVSGHEYPDASQVAVGISPDGTMVVSGDNLGRINFWKFSPDILSKNRGIECIKEITTDDSKTRGIQAIQFSRDGKYILVSGDEALLYDGESKMHDCLGSLRVTDMEFVASQSNYNVHSWFFTKDDMYLLTGCDDNNVRFWRMDELPIFSATGLEKDRNAGDEVAKTVDRMAGSEQSTDVGEDELKKIERSLRGVMTFSFESEPGAGSDSGSGSGSGSVPTASEDEGDFDMNIRDTSSRHLRGAELDLEPSEDGAANVDLED